MSESIKEDMLRRILDRLPSVPCACRIDPETGKAEWLYASPQLAAIYGVTEEELRGDPFALTLRMEPEDRARFLEMSAATIQTLAPMTWSGRVRFPSGELRWIETRTVYERDVDGSILSYGQVVDVTEQKRTEQLHRAVIDVLPSGIIAMTPDGKLPIYNRAAEQYASRDQDLLGTDISSVFGIFRTDGFTPFPNEEMPLTRAIAGEEAPEAELIIRNSRYVGDRWLRVTGAPIRDESGAVIAGMVITHDVTAQRAIEQELRATNAQLSESEQGKAAAIDELRGTIGDMENPILEVWDDVLVMPIIGVVDSRRTIDMVQRLLVEVARAQAGFVIVDLTGVEVVDTRTADHLIKLVRKVEIVGARCVLTGIRPAVSETLVDIGVDFSRVTTLRNLKHGLKEAIRFARRGREDRDDLHGDETSEAPRARAVARPPRR